MRSAAWRHHTLPTLKCWLTRDPKCPKQWGPVTMGWSLGNHEPKETFLPWGSQIFGYRNGKLTNTSIASLKLWVRSQVHAAKQCLSRVLGAGMKRHKQSTWEREKRENHSIKHKKPWGWLSWWCLLTSQRPQFSGLAGNPDYVSFSGPPATSSFLPSLLLSLVKSTELHAGLWTWNWCLPKDLGIFSSLYIDCTLPSCTLHVVPVYMSPTQRHLCSKLLSFLISLHPFSRLNSLS